MKNILFVCIENSNRSQMAQAFAKIYGAKKVIAYSAGSKPSGKINPKAISAMHDIGYDLSVHDSKSLAEIPDIEYEYAITMGCGDECQLVKAKHRIDWQIPDPRNLEGEAFNKIRDDIKNRVIKLLKTIS